MRYLLYIKNLFRYKQWRMAVHIGDIVFTVLNLLLILIWIPSIDKVIKPQDRTLIFILSSLSLLCQFFWAIHSAKKAVDPEKTTFYKIIGFTKIDFFLLVLHSFFFMSISGSFFFGLVFNAFLVKTGLWVALPFFIIQTAAIFAIMFLLKKNFKLLKSKKKHLIQVSCFQINIWRLQ